MIFYHKPYNPNNTNLNKKKTLVIYALNPKKYTNYIMQKRKKKIRIFLEKPDFKDFKLQRFVDRKNNNNNNNNKLKKS